MSIGEGITADQHQCLGMIQSSSQPILQNHEGYAPGFVVFCVRGIDRRGLVVRNRSSQANNLRSWTGFPCPMHRTVELPDPY